MTPPAIGTRVLLDCDGGPVPCEVIALDELRGLARMRMILPGKPRDGLTFWRPWDAPVLDADPSPSSARPIRLGGDGDSPHSGSGSAAEAAGMGACRLPLCDVDRTSRAGVPVAGARPVAGADTSKGRNSAAMIGGQYEAGDGRAVSTGGLRAIGRTSGPRGSLRPLVGLGRDGGLDRLRTRGRQSVRLERSQPCGRRDGGRGCVGARRIALGSPRPGNCRVAPMRFGWMARPRHRG